jgi:toxin-antitoxin system PIN domain toxin
VIAVDTNILVHAHRVDSPWHEAAFHSLRDLAEQRWSIPWPCVHEFLAIVTHPRIFDPPTPLADALKAVDVWLAAPTLELLAEQAGYWEMLHEILQSSRVTGPRVHDARIAVLCLFHAVDEIWTADRDFSRFSGLQVHNPLLPNQS